MKKTPPQQNQQYNINAKYNNLNLVNIPNSNISNNSYNNYNNNNNYNKNISDKKITINITIKITIIIL